MSSNQTRQRVPSRATAPAVATPPRWIAGPQWADLRLRQPGWLILPLRLFLGMTFGYAGLQKLANPTYLDPHNRSSVVGQMQVLQHSSPIGPLLSLSLHAPTLVGLLIAFGELGIGIGVLLGLWSRLAALAGMLLSLTFFLTVSWATTPYYYGSDIVFLFAWSVIAAFGTGDVLSVDGWLRARARRLSGLPFAPAIVSVEATRLRQLCSRAEACGLGAGGACARHSGCPVFPATEQLHPGLQAQVDRRALLLGARAAGLVAVVATTGAGLTAIIGRLAGGTNQAHPLALSRRSASRPATTAPTAPSASPHSASAAPAAPGTAIGPATDVPVGQAARFTDPASGQPAWVVQPSANQFVAFSAICTHAGCAVGFDPSSLEFVCPCHGGTYDAKTGQVLGGPPPSPLPAIPVHVVNGQIRVD